MTKKNFNQECINTVEVLESLKNELLGLNTFENKVVELVKLINKNNYRIEIQNIYNNSICSVARKQGLKKYLKQIFTLWDGAIKTDTIIVHTDNTIIWGDFYYNEDYSIDEIIEEISYFQNNKTIIF